MAGEDWGNSGGGGGGNGPPTPPPPPPSPMYLFSIGQKQNVFMFMDDFVFVNVFFLLFM